MNRTKIEWVKNPDGTPGYTLNPITGCLNHTNGLCKGGGFPCYAYQLAHGRLLSTYGFNTNLAPSAKGSFKSGADWVGDLTGDYADPFYPRFWPERVDRLSMERWQKPRGIFVCDMSDLFGIGVPEHWTAQVLSAISYHPESRFYLLTKQPQNLPKWSPFPENCWVGVTACTPQMLTNALYGLMRIKAKVKYISFEPLLEWQKIKDISALAESFQIAGINWVIIGAQTKPYKPPEWPWVEEILKAADRAGIPVFLKDNLGKMDMRGEWDRELWLGKNLCLRQEMPK